MMAEEAPKGSEQDGQLCDRCSLKKSPTFILSASAFAKTRRARRRCEVKSDKENPCSRTTINISHNGDSGSAHKSVIMEKFRGEEEMDLLQDNHLPSAKEICTHLRNMISSSLREL